jgi:hypothetical protein
MCLQHIAVSRVPRYICVLLLLLLYMCHHTFICVRILLMIMICVLILLYVCPHTTIYVSSYYYTGGGLGHILICILILLYCILICILILLYCRGIYVSSYCYICVLTLIYMGPHTTIYVSSYYYTGVCSTSLSPSALHITPIYLASTSYYMCLHTTVSLASQYYYTCFLMYILLYRC